MSFFRPFPEKRADWAAGVLQLVLGGAEVGAVAEGPRSGSAPPEYLSCHLGSAVRVLDLQPADHELTGERSAGTDLIVVRLRTPPPPSPSEHRKLLTGALRLTLWRVTVARKRADCGV